MLKTHPQSTSLPVIAGTFGFNYIKNLISGRLKAKPYEKTSVQSSDFSTQLTGARNNPRLAAVRTSYNGTR